MKPYRFSWRWNVVRLICLLLLLPAVACTTAADLEKRRSQGEASRLVGEAYLKQGQYTLALREFLKAETIYPKDPVLHNDLGLTYVAKNQLDLAIPHYNKAVQLKPDYAPARNNLGHAYLMKSDWDGAIEALTPLIGDLLYATPHYPLSNLGFAYYNKKDYVRAEQHYLEALGIEPGFVYALGGLGKTYIRMGKIGDAVSVLRKAIQASPRSPQLFFDMGRAFALSKEYPEARHAYGKVLELAPGTPLAEDATREMGKITD